MINNTKQARRRYMGKVANIAIFVFLLVSLGLAARSMIRFRALDLAPSPSWMEIGENSER